MDDGTFKDAMELVGKVVDVLGVATIVLGIAIATGLLLARSHRTDDPLRRYRQGVGRAILLGLEFLVAADIIRTVAVEPSFTNAGILALVVLIRTFLSFTLELELTGRWPWQARPPQASS
ncbi:DUF1622 domain-containing protein [Patulibacter sp.]|uniref:DUF1622 domain-containing protein n=1 Tax=Patulibacter sp. TaxID=1912859 RepID=UPI002727C736|nr:DUF1622 domain-containing protein [Patulibacter sp.]MDO9410329.1 DUF1622 domain-containing protein [Patulibacter sp.]